MKHLVLYFVSVLLAATCAFAQRVDPVPSHFSKSSKFAMPAGKHLSSTPTKGSPSLQQNLNPLGKYLNPDGTLNTPPGFEGSLDPKGWRMTTSHSGKPHFVRSTASLLTDPADSAWDDEFGLDGLNYVVNTIAVSGTDLYVGGGFTTAANVAVNYIAKWDGTSWSALGTGMDNWVYAIAVQGTDVYAGGYFTTAGGVSANYIAKWNGTSWSALGTGLDSAVLGLSFIGTDLYVGGYFANAGGVSANRVAKWDGSNWSALGTGMNSYVWFFASIGTDVYACGDFTTAGGVSANYIAKWDGTNWSALGTGMDADVLSLAVMGTDLYAGGTFTTAGGISANYVAKWDGTNWSALGTGMTGSYVGYLQVVGSDLYAGGNFTMAGGIPASNVARWNGTNWLPLGAGTDQDIYWLVANGSNLYAGGIFTTAGGVSANYIAKWDGLSWSPLTSSGAYSGMSGGDESYGENDVFALLVHGSNVYAGGVFSIAGGVHVNGIAKWDGTHWSALGTGMGGGSFNANPYYTIVYALAMIGNDLYAGGTFTTADGNDAEYIAKWDGTTWSALGGGMDNPVQSLATDGSNLYAGGSFTTAGVVSANYIAKWDGTSWSALGTGMSDGFYSTEVVALTAIGTNLYAGGDFATAGGVTVNNIAKWDGTSWSALGTGMSGNFYNPVFALAVMDTNLYAGGYFLMAGGVTVNNIAKWDGTSWSALGTGTDADVDALIVDGKNLYAGGYFTMAGGAGASSIAKWDGTNWSALGSGIGSLIVSSTVLSLAGSGPYIYAGGQFTEAGSKPSSDIARWGVAKKVGVSLTTNWNMVSLPVVPTNDSVSAVYPGESGGAFSYVGGSYSPQDRMQNGTGYWVRFTSPATDTLAGGSIDDLSIPVVDGWNLIGAITKPVGVSSITSNPPGMVTSAFFGYEGSYAPTDSLRPGRAYWVKTTGDGTLEVSTLVASAVPANRIRIVPTNEMPPPAPIGVSAHPTGIPKEFALGQNYPNPFNPSTVISYQLPVDSKVTLTVYDMIGREVATLVDGEQSAGYKSVEWNAAGVASGVYFYKLQAGTFNEVKKLVLLR